MSSECGENESGRSVDGDFAEEVARVYVQSVHGETVRNVHVSLTSKK